MRNVKTAAALVCALAVVLLFSVVGASAEGLDLKAREMDSAQTEKVARQDAKKARKAIRLPGDAMAVIYNRLERDVYRRLIDGAWESAGHNAFRVRSGEYGYPGGSRYVDPNTLNQMIAWLLSDDMEIGVVMGFPEDGPQTSVCCIRSEKGICVFNGAAMMGVNAPGVPHLPTGDFSGFQEYVEKYLSRDSVRTMYYLPGGIGICWKDYGSHVESTDKEPVLLWSADPEENTEFDWLK